MAFRAAVMLSRTHPCSVYGRVNIVATAPIFFSQPLANASRRRTYHNEQNRDHGGRNGYQGTWSQRLKLGFGIGLGMAAPVIISGLGHNEILADEELKRGGEVQEDKLKERETRVRKTQTIDRIFDYFATYRYMNGKDKPVNLMGVKDFYNAVTPGSSITHGTGLKSESDYDKVTESDIHSAKLYECERIPAGSGHSSILNAIQKEGLLSYTDFCFLNNILATPRRYLDIVFLAFDIEGDGLIKAKEYLEVMSHITKHTGGLRRYDDCGRPDELIAETYSGLMNFFFGRDRDKAVNREKFLKFREEVIDDILWLEFTRYYKTLPDIPNMSFPKFQHPIITDVEFCEHLLANANITSKQKKKMINRVTKFFGSTAENPSQVAEGITFEAFKSFYHILYCGMDLERTMFFLNRERGGISREEFKEISTWISDMEVDEHVVDVIFLLLDEADDRVISIEELQPILYEWRHYRGFLQASSGDAGIIDLKLS